MQIQRKRLWRLAPKREVEILPTKKSRKREASLTTPISVAFNDEQAALIAEIARKRGWSRSKVIRELALIGLESGAAWIGE